MTIIPGLTSTRKDRIPAWIQGLRHSAVRTVALFPTVLSSSERRALYEELSTIEGLHVPHVHLRTDCDEREMEYLTRTFGTSLFNIHPAGTRHEFGSVPVGFESRVYVENVDAPPADHELGELGGICVDYSHLESARARGRGDYVATVERQMSEFPIGCCHVSAIRKDDPNAWNGGPDHHEYLDLSHLDYMTRYAESLPPEWASLELENTFDEQLDAIEYLGQLFAHARPEETSAAEPQPRKRA